MKYLYALFAAFTPFAWGADLLVVNSPTDFLGFDGPHRVIVLEGAIIGDSNGASMLAIRDTGPIDLDIYGGMIPGSISLFNENPNRITIKGGVISDSINVLSSQAHQIEIYGTNLEYTLYEENGLGNSGTITGTLADGNDIDIVYVGNPDSLRFLDPEDFEDVTICRGPPAFADEVLFYDPGPDVDQIVENLLDPQQALGPPDWVGAPNDADTSGAVSLGDGGSIVVRFVNNGLIGDGTPKPDIIVFKSGNIVEQVIVEISIDGNDWINVGTTNGGTDALDIDDDNTSLLDTYFYVRVMDLAGQGGGIPSSSGAEVDAIATLFDRGFNPVTDAEACAAIEVKFQTYLESIYQIQRSSDMENWEIEEDNVVGTGGEISRFYSASDPRSFYRIMPKLAEN